MRVFKFYTGCLLLSLRLCHGFAVWGWPRTFF